MEFVFNVSESTSAEGSVPRAGESSLHYPVERTPEKRINAYFVTQRDVQGGTELHVFGSEFSVNTKFVSFSSRIFSFVEDSTSLLNW
jgi:hypothetical protein